MLRYFVAPKEMFCTARGRTQPDGSAPELDSGCVPPSPERLSAVEHGQGRASQFVFSPIRPSRMPSRFSRWPHAVRMRASRRARVGRSAPAARRIAGTGCLPGGVPRAKSHFHRQARGPVSRHSSCAASWSASWPPPCSLCRAHRGSDVRLSGSAAPRVVGSSAPPPCVISITACGEVRPPRAAAPFYRLRITLGGHSPGAVLRADYVRSAGRFRIRWDDGRTRWVRTDRRAMRALWVATRRMPPYPALGLRVP
jgi:hypothetical protein